LGTTHGRVSKAADVAAVHCWRMTSTPSTRCRRRPYPRSQC